MKSLLVLACVLQLGLALSPYKGISANTTIFGNGDASDAVFVTPFLPGNFTAAQKLSKIEIAEFEMYSGFFTIDASTDSNTYFVFSEAQSGKKDAPVLLWLQGGPGASSLFGLFTELGPFNIDKDMKIAPRDISWNKDYHMLFLDNPLGTGFSFTGELDRMATNQTTVGQDLYSALSQFYELFPDLRANDFFVTGESYAGKYVPSCAFEIHNQNMKVEASKKINLKGIAIGDGAFDPAGQFYNFWQLLYYMGMADDMERAQYMKYETEWKGKIDSGDNVGAFRVFDEMLNGDFFPYPTYYANQTGMGSNYFNFNQGPDGSSLTKNYFIDWLGTTTGRNMMHVGEVPYYVENSTVETQLLGDWMVGVTDKLTVLLENYRVLIYSGQYDVILGPPLTEQSLRNLKWSGQEQYQLAAKKTWHIDTDVAGYYRSVGDFTQLIVRGAGHMVPGDQPARAFDMIERFVANKPFGPE